MKIRLISVGKTDIAWVCEGLDMYVSRLKRYIAFEIVEIPQLKGTASLDRETIKSKEGELIMRHLRPSEFVVLLDEKGDEMRSVEFASRLSRHFSSDGRDIAFVIGGAYGFSAQVYERGNGRMSLSKMTFSHQGVRVVFAEQLYRAFTIINGEPYHHE